MRIIAVANQKGGCGKTTTSINLTAALASNGKKVLLLDLDPQAHASLGLNVDSQDSIYNVISKITPRKLSIDQIIQSIDKKFDLVPSNVLVGTLEQELSDEIGRELKLATIFETIKDRYDYIVIDCPPNLGFLTINALRACSEVIIPVETSRFSLQGVDRLLDIIRLVKDRLNHNITSRVLVTMFDSRLRHSFSMLDKIRDQFSKNLIVTIVHLNVKLKEAAVMGQSVLDYDKYCRGSKDYFSLAKELITQENPIEQTEDPLFSTMSPTMKKVVKEKVKDFGFVLFSLDAPEAKSVYVAGDFNNWYVDESCRMKQNEGIWTASLKLRPGKHQYRFIVDGRWQEDPDNPNRAENAFGDANSVVEVVSK
ncbi:MAG: AAA family ATPase [Candidatus Omnitrophica bacterium]|nr:AAA family ATPase [Candidatus Omnitrophota bacterium]